MPNLIVACNSYRFAVFHTTRMVFSSTDRAMYLCSISLAAVQ